MKVEILTLGCKVNHYESEAMAELFKNKGYEIVKDQPADVYIINTCTVTGMSDRKSRQMISRAKNENEDALIAVVGCYSQIAPSDIEKLDEVDVILGTTNRYKIVEACEEARRENKRINLVEKLEKGKIFEPLKVVDNSEKTRAYVKIQEGCNQFCTYCIIPYARGPITSRDRFDIIEEVKKLAQNGYKEIVLTGIHVASYGKDKDDEDALIELIEEISKIDGIERIRFSSLEPNIVTKEFLERLKNTKKVCDHFHLSLQAGSSSVLKRMNRKYDYETYRDKINLIREVFANAGLTTDIIVGFPGETDYEFEETIKAVHELNFSKVHVFRYSRRIGTPAARFKDQVDGAVKKERSKILIELSEKKMIEFIESQIGTETNVLFETKKDSFYQGYSTSYLKVEAMGENLEGQIKRVRLVGYEKEDSEIKAFGEILD